MLFINTLRFSQVLLTLLILLSLSLHVNAHTTAAEVGIFEALQVAPGETLQVPVSIRNATDLYGLDVTVLFDPNILQVEDTDPARTGVQVSLGTFLDPVLLLFNTVDNGQGTIHFAMSQAPTLAQATAIPTRPAVTQPAKQGARQTASQTAAGSLAEQSNQAVFSWCRTGGYCSSC